MRYYKATEDTRHIAAGTALITFLNIGQYPTGAWVNRQDDAIINRVSVCTPDRDRFGTVVEISEQEARELSPVLFQDGVCFDNYEMCKQSGM